MKPMTSRRTVTSMMVFLILLFLVCSSSAQSPRTENSAVSARPITIPVTIRVKGKISPESELRPVDFTISEDGEPQTILSIRALGTNSPINLLVLIQDDVVSSVALEIKPPSEFVR